MTELTAEPTAMKAVWFPATVILPDTTEQLRVCKVYATDAGLVVYQRTDAGITEVFRSPIDYDRTAKPRHPRNGFEVYTDDGTVRVTANGGCGCGNPLKRWSPDFARKAVRW